PSGHAQKARGPTGWVPSAYGASYLGSGSTFPRKNSDLARRSESGSPPADPCLPGLVTCETAKTTPNSRSVRGTYKGDHLGQAPYSAFGASARLVCRGWEGDMLARGGPWAHSNAGSAAIKAPDTQAPTQPAAGAKMQLGRVPHRKRGPTFGEPYAAPRSPQ